MKIYLAGQCPYPEAEQHAIRKHGRFLYSYAYLLKKNTSALRREWSGRDVLLDSGGYTVRVSGKTIDVRNYANFISRLGRSITACINLDTNDIHESIRNQRVLESLGSNPIPVYHFEEWANPSTRGILDQYISEGDYIALGGVANRNNGKEKNKQFFSYCFIRGGKRTRFHGLGITSSSTMAYFPFYSVDSKTWLVSGLYGDFIETKNAKYRRVAKRKGSISHYGVMLSGPEKMKRAVDAFNLMERHLTAIWAKRGYVWN